MNYCKRCGAEIEWKEVNTRDGPKMHPFNAGTNVSHFKTCPYAGEFRRPKRRDVEDLTPVKVNMTLDEYLG
jgi:hypothetical protein